MSEDQKDKIIRMLEKKGHPMHLRELMKKCKVREKKLFSRDIEELRRQGILRSGKKGMVELAQERTRKRATIVSLSKGFAFARPQDGTEDLFLHADHLQGAMVNDVVELKNIRNSPKGKSAQVASILERAKRSTTGTVEKMRDGYVLKPDIAIRYPIPISKKDLQQAKDGDKVLAELYRKSRKDSLRARVAEVYGKSQSAKVCADAILAQNGIPSQFPDEVLDEARGIREFTEEDLKGRLDLRQTSICTIDGEDAKDLDDAISVSRTKNGYKLGVHIADVSHYVNPKTAIDQEALSRGTSVYFADRVIPMLPKELSNGVCSLNAHEDKLTFSAIIELNREGEILSYRFKKSVIHSKVRGVYAEVNQLFSGKADAQLKKKYAPVIRSLHAARELADILKQRARKMGTMDLQSREAKFTLNEAGVCIDVQPRKSGEAEEMIEQLMITANQAAAMLAKEANLPFIYRVHGSPDPDRVKSLVQLVNALGINASCLDKENPCPADFSELLRRAKGTPAERMISHQVLRTMEKAKYSADPLGHFGLFLKDYCHFTSPIRRYPDLAIHRILSQYLATPAKKRDEITIKYGAFVKEAALQSSQCEIRAMTAERSAEDCYMAEYMKAHIGECFDGIVSGVTMRGVFVELENMVEGFVPIESFVECRYRFDGMLAQVDEVTGKKLTIGDTLRIRVVSADVASGKIDFCPDENKKME